MGCLWPAGPRRSHSQLGGIPRASGDMLSPLRLSTAHPGSHLANLQEEAGRAKGQEQRVNPPEEEPRRCGQSEANPGPVWMCWQISTQAEGS